MHVVGRISVDEMVEEGRNVDMYVSSYVSLGYVCGLGLAKTARLPAAQTHYKSQAHNIQPSATF